MVAVLYHSRSLCCFSPAYDVGPQLRRHNIADSEVPLSLGCCRRSAARCVGQRAVPGPDLHCALPALSLSVCITAASIRTHCTTWPPHLHMASRTCTWPPAPAHGLRTLHLPTHRCRIQRIQPSPQDVSNAPKKTRVPPPELFNFHRPGDLPKSRCAGARTRAVETMSSAEYAVVFRVVHGCAVFGASGAPLVRAKCVVRLVRRREYAGRIR